MLQEVKDELDTIFKTLDKPRPASLDKTVKWLTDYLDRKKKLLHEFWNGEKGIIAYNMRYGKTQKSDLERVDQIQVKINFANRALELTQEAIITESFAQQISRGCAYTAAAA